MSRIYKPSDGYVKTFTVCSPTGAAADADSTPAGTIYVNGAASATAVTVTNPATGVYRAAAPALPGGAGDVVELLIAATVGGVATKAVVDAVRLVAFSPGDAVRLGLSALPGAAAAAAGGLPTVGATIPDATAGAAGGLFIAGTNAATAVTAAFTATIAGDLTGSVGSLAAQAKADVEDAVWDGLHAAHTGAGSFGDYLDSSISGVATGGVTPPTAVEIRQEMDANSAKLARLDAAVSSRFTYAGGPVASVAAPVSVNLAQAGLTPRNLGAVADGSLTVGDALVAAIAGAAGKQSVAGTSYQVRTPSTGAVIRAFTLDDATNPTSRT